ncbi:hypothetical protein [Flavobacterium aestuarii]|uniref:hypothetical protein n=1 Tax=Flavobacterium aestuarii TaxID=3149227 RepID=UPI0032B60EDC
MKTLPITEYNPKALKEISEHLEFSEYSNSPVIQKITYVNYVDITHDLVTILDAIEVIGYQGNKQDLGTCAGLAEIAKKMLPRKEMEFLDSLLIKAENDKNEFLKIENL